MDAPGGAMLAQWRRMKRLPFGTQLFAIALAQMVPYSGSVGARVIELEPGLARLEMRDRRALRNHLGSIHAIALANLGELASGLAMSAALPQGVRAIVTGLEIEYLKKARGRITAESRVTLPPITGDLEHRVQAELRDAAGDPVARVTARWRLRPA